MFTCYYEFAKARDLRLVLRPRQGPPARIRAGAVRPDPLHTRGHRRHACVLRRAGATGLRAGCRERTAVRPPGDRAAEMTGRRMSRRLPAALRRGRASLRPSRFPSHSATTPARRSFVVYAKPTRAQFINHTDDRARGNFTNPFSADALPTPPERELREEGGAGRRQRALHPQAVFRRQAHATRRHRGVLLHVQLRPGSDLRGQVRAQRRDHDRDGPGGSQER